VRQRGGGQEKSGLEQGMVMRGTSIFLAEKSIRRFKSSILTATASAPTANPKIFIPTQGLQSQLAIVDRGIVDPWV